MVRFFLLFFLVLSMASRASSPVAPGGKTDAMAFAGNAEETGKARNAFLEKWGGYMALCILFGLFLIRPSRLRRKREIAREHALFYAMPGSTIVFNEDGDCVFRIAEEAARRRDGELILKLPQMADPQDFPQVESVFRKVLQTGGQEPLEFRMNGIGMTGWAVRLDKACFGIDLVMFHYQQTAVLGLGKGTLEEATRKVWEANQSALQREADEKKAQCMADLRDIAQVLWANAERMEKAETLEEGRKAGAAALERLEALEARMECEAPVGIPAEKRIARDASPLEEEAGKEVRLLVVESSPEVQAAVTGMLLRLRVQVDNALSAEEAFQFLQRRYFNGILLNLQLPNLNGMEFLSLLRRDSRFANVPVYGMTGDPLSGKNMDVTGFAGILRKPFASGELVTLVRQLRS